MKITQVTFYHFRNAIRLRFIYKALLRLLGAKIGWKTSVPWTTKVTWPHKIKIGDHCILKSNVILHFDGPWSKGHAIVLDDHIFLGHGVEFNVSCHVRLGAHCLIGSGTRFIDHNHDVSLAKLIREQQCSKKAITLEKDCWIGSSTIILAGVTISEGAVVGAGSLVKSDIPANEIWAGAPASKIGERI